MAKKKTKGMNDKEFKIIAGIVLILIALIGIGDVITVLLFLLGAYLIYEGLKKR